MKKSAVLITAALVGATASAQAQTWSSLGVVNNNGTPFWDNSSFDGSHCNVGYVVTGVAGTAGNSCANQRPGGWLPYTGTTPTTYLESASGGFQAFSLSSGSWGFSLLPGSSSSGGDIAGANQDWGYIDLTTLAMTSLNGGIPGSPVDMADTWAFYIQMTNGNYAYSNSDNQFAVFGFNTPGSPSYDAGTTWILGIEDIYTGSGGNSDVDYQDELVQFSYLGPTSPPTEVPEPGTMTLLATGLVGMAAAARRRRKSV